MLNHEDKIEVLKAYLSDIEDNYADSFKTDIWLYFDAFENVEEGTIKFNFLKSLKSKRDIQNWIDKLTSKIVMKYNEEEEQLSDFIYYETICSITRN